MRRALDALYRASGFLSALFLMMIGVTILLQIAGRFLHFTFDATEISGFCMAASTFLGLAYTLHAGTHMHYNFVRIHKTLKMTPAMAAGVTPKLWEMADMVKVLEDWEAEQS